jgi:hypothetical protein
MRSPFREICAVFTGSLQDSPSVPPAGATETYHFLRFNRVKGVLLEQNPMSRFKFLLLAVGLAATPLPLLAATPGAVQAEQSPTMPGPQGGLGRHHDGGRLAGLLTPEQRIAFMLQAREQTRDMDHDQRRAWRKDQISQLKNMSETDRQKFRADLQARWDAFPADRKARIEQRLAQRNAPSPAQ